MVYFNLVVLDALLNFIGKEKLNVRIEIFLKTFVTLRNKLNLWKFIY